MGSLSCLTDPSIPVVLDTSVVINLTASGFAIDIANALPNRLVVVDAVAAELDLGRRRERPHANLLEQLVAAGEVEVVSLSEAATVVFESLVIGPAANTLDDGEAATLAYAVDAGALAVIDERKAVRCCSDKSLKVQVGSSCDLFSHLAVLNRIGPNHLSRAVLNALQHARMQVHPHFLEWAVDLIGTDQAIHCPSLPRRVRLKV